MAEKKPKKEVAEVEETTVPALPAERMKKRGIKKLDKEDQMIPRIKVMQGLSPEVQEGLAKYGDLVNSLTKENYGKEVTLVPIDWWVSRIYWRDRKEGGGIVCRSFDAIKGSTCGVCSECPHRNWTTSDDGKQVPSNCVKIFNVLCALIKEEGKPEIIVASFLKTSFKAGKEWINVMQYKNVDLFNYQYKLFTESITNDFGTFNILKYKDMNTIAPDNIYKDAEALYTQYADKPIKVDDVEEESTDADNKPTEF